ncbi:MULTISPECIES: transposase domain-containing protein [Streptomyces]|uniref:transposase domain-containing protein n=1 Tax=Streptomyces TaxID=1883 RepID=UPI001F32C056|nr:MULTISPECIES: transposase domain-containing protein [Streptomyces]
MCLFSGRGYEEVARLLTHGLAWAKRWSGSWQLPTTAAISGPGRSWVRSRSRHCSTRRPGLWRRS